MSHRSSRRRHAYQAASRAASRAEPGPEPARPPKKTDKPPRCASRFGHAFAVTDIYGSVTTYPDGDAPRAGKRQCTSTSYEADEHCTRRGCHATRHTDGRPSSRGADGTPSYSYGALPPAACSEKDAAQKLVRPDRVVRRRTNGHIDAKPAGENKPDGGKKRRRKGRRRRVS